VSKHIIVCVLQVLAEFFVSFGDEVSIFRLAFLRFKYPKAAAALLMGNVKFHDGSAAHLHIPDRLCKT
jgi:hypothetical protein